MAAVMRLEGFRCDRCKAETMEKQGEWLHVVSMPVSKGLDFPGRLITWSEASGLDYCSRACLRAAMDEDWKKERR